MGSKSDLGFSLAIVLMTLVSSCFAGDAQWIEVRSPNFSVVTDAGDRRGRDAALRFEQMRAVFGALMVKAKVNTPVPLQIIGFRNSKELRQFAPIFQGKPTDVDGLFQPGDDRGFIMLNMSAEDPWQVVFHEYAHQLMNGNVDVSTDPWFEEGFAEYFSSIEVDGKEAHVGKIPHDEYMVLDQVSWLRISDLLRVQHYSKTYNENGDHRSVFYAESGMLVHYLYETGLMAKAGDYFGLIREKHLSVEDAVQQAWGMSPAQLEKTLRSYESSHHFMYYQMRAPAGIDSKTYTSTPMAAADVQAVLADVHLHSPDHYQQAAEEFEAVLKLDPNNAAALRGLGYSYLIKKDYQRAGEYFHKSAERNPNDSRVLYYSAMLAQREGFTNTNPEQLNTAQKELETSIKLDPEFADAYSLLAYIYMTQAHTDQAIQTMIKAIHLNPGNESYRFNLAEMCVSAQKLDAATKILESLKDSGNPEMAAQAERELARLQTYREEQRFAERARVTMNNETDDGATNPATRHEEPETAPVLSVRPASPAPAAKFLKGKLISVDCSVVPSAVLTVVDGAKTWKLHARDTAHTVVIGADNFSCAWSNQKVGINYRQTGEAEGDVISLEIQ